MILGLCEEGVFLGKPRTAQHGNKADSLWGDLAFLTMFFKTKLLM